MLSYPYKQLQFSSGQHHSVLVRTATSPASLYVQPKWESFAKQAQEQRRLFQNYPVLGPEKWILAPAVNQPCLYSKEGINYRAVITNVLREGKVGIQLVILIILLT